MTLTVGAFLELSFAYNLRDYAFLFEKLKYLGFDSTAISPTTRSFLTSRHHKLFYVEQVASK